jgi:hypothetical protein
MQQGRIRYIFATNKGNPLFGEMQWITMATGTFVSWRSFINALGLGLISILLIVIGTIYSGFFIPPFYVNAVGIAIATAYLVYAETGIVSRVRFVVPLL